MKKRKSLTDYALTKERALMVLLPDNQVTEEMLNDVELMSARSALVDFCATPGSEVDDDYLVLMLTGHDPHGVLRDRSDDAVHAAFMADLDTRVNRALAELIALTSTTDAHALPSVDDQYAIALRASDNFYEEMARIMDELEVATKEERWGRVKELIAVSHAFRVYLINFISEMERVNEHVRGIIKKSQKPSPGDRGTHLSEADKLRLQWESLERTSLRYLKSTYLDKPAASDQPKIVRESVAYAIAQVGSFRARKEATIDDLFNNLYMSQIIIKGADTALALYRRRGVHAIDLNKLHYSADGNGFWHLKFLTPGQRAEITAKTAGPDEFVLQSEQAALRKAYECCAKDDHKCLIRAEIRALGTGKGDDRKRIVGFVPFDSESEDLGGFTEVLKPGAFAHALAKGSEIHSLWQHQMDKPLGTTQNGTLEIHEGPTGLHYTVFPNLRTSYGKDAYESVTRGDVHGTSFGFRMKPGGDKWPKRPGTPLREIHTIDTLSEVSPVTFPAYKSTVAVTKEGEL